MFVLGVAVMFSGVLSEVVAAGRRATLLTFVLPACTAPGPIHERLTGWLIALAVCVPAALFLFPPATTTTCAVMPRRCAAHSGTASRAPRRPGTSTGP